MRALLVAIFLIIVFLPERGQALSVSMAPAHFGRAMEFYYVNPKPEMLEGILRSFAENRVLAKGENRFLLGAFLGELAASSKVRLDDYIPLAHSLGRDARVTLAWSAHLSSSGNADLLVARLIDPEDRLVLGQIRRSPSPLSRWQGTEKSVLFMYWGAFMACGRICWVESIIDCALDYAEHPDSACAAYAAASLYEYAPRHAPVAAAVRKRLGQVNGEKKRVLEKVLAALEK